MTFAVAFRFVGRDSPAGLPFMDVFAVQPVVDGRIEDDPHQKHFDGQHHRVFDGTRGQVVKIPLAVEHGFPHTAQQHVTAVVDDEPHHNNAQQVMFCVFFMDRVFILV